MKNKGLYITLGVLAAAGIGFYLYKRSQKSSASGEDKKSGVISSPKIHCGICCNHEFPTGACKGACGGCGSVAKKSAKSTAI